MVRKIKQPTATVSDGQIILTVSLPSSVKIGDYYWISVVLDAKDANQLSSDLINAAATAADYQETECEKANRRPSGSIILHG